MKIPTEQTLKRMAFTVGEVAISLGVCDKTIYKMIRNGIIKPFLTSPLLISTAELNRLTNGTIRDNNLHRDSVFCRLDAGNK